MNILAIFLHLPVFGISGQLPISVLAIYSNSPCLAVGLAHLIFTECINASFCFCDIVVNHSAHFCFVCDPDGLT